LERIAYVFITKKVAHHGIIATVFHASNGVYCTGFLESAEEIFGKQIIQDTIKKNSLMVRLSIEPDEKLKYLPHDTEEHCIGMSFFVPYHFLEKKKEDDILKVTFYKNGKAKIIHFFCKQKRKPFFTTFENALKNIKQQAR